MVKTCPQTKEEFIPRRTNQIYLNSKARIKFNNDKARAKRMITRSIDYAINNNWNILLKQLSGSDKTTRSKEFLLGAGFDFNYYQRAYVANAGTMHVIYNCGIVINDDEVLIFKLQ